MTSRRGLASLAVIVAGLIACASARGADSDIPSAQLGDPKLSSGGGFTHSVSASFERPGLEAIYAKVKTPAFRSALAEFNCGEPVPKFRWYMAIKPAAKYSERLLEVSYEPHIDVVEQRCLSFGLSYLFEVEMFGIDKGEPINYHYRDPMTGKEFPPEKPHLPRKPHCECSKRGSPGEWVTFPEPAPGEPAEK